MLQHLQTAVLLGTLGKKFLSVQLQSIQFKKEKGNIWILQWGLKPEKFRQSLEWNTY